MENNCLYCKKEIPATFGRNRIRKFCGYRCSQNFHYHNKPEFNKNRKEYAKRYAELHRKDPEYRTKQKIANQKWRQANRERFNELVKKSQRKRRKLGLCGCCGKVKSKNYYCKKCSEKHNGRRKK